MTIEANHFISASAQPEAATLTSSNAANTATAHPDFNTCYTGCAPETPVSPTPEVTPTTVPGAHINVVPETGLAFTGADVLQLAAIGLGATMVGAHLVWKSRRARSREA